MLAMLLDLPPVEKVEKQLQDLTFDETFRPLEESIFCTPSVLDGSRMPKGNVGVGKIFPNEVPTKESSPFPTPLAPQSTGASPNFPMSRPDPNAASLTAVAGVTRAHGASWSLFPESISIDAGKDIGGKLIKINNMSSKPLSFELSFPAHALTATPSQGVVSALSSLSVSISPARPLLDMDDGTFPWKGNLYVNGDDGATVSVKVAVNREIPPVVTPDTPSQTTLTLGSSSSSATTLSELSFPLTRTGENNVALLVVQNGRRIPLRWRLTPFSPAYVKFEGNQKPSKREPFRAVVLSGLLKPQCEAKVVVQFCPMEPGTYVQSWELEGVPDDGGPRSNRRVQMVASAFGPIVAASAVESMPEAAPLPPPRVEAVVEAPRRPQKENVAPLNTNRGVATVAPVVVATVMPDAGLVKNSNGMKKNNNNNKRPVTLKDQILEFPPTERGRHNVVSMVIRNHSNEARDVSILRVAEPFNIKQKHLNITIKARSFLGVPIEFRPPEKGTFRTNVIVNLGPDDTDAVAIVGSCVDRC